MAERQCEKCGEMVDAVRAFCPSCGSPFVEEEKREQQSKYERLDHTMQMGKTMYNQMRSDMGLNISKPETEKRVEVIAPIPAAPEKQQAPIPDQTRQEILKPVAAPSRETQKSQVVQPTTATKRKTYII